MFICVCSSLCTTVAHNTAQNRPDNFPCCPPDNHHCSDDVSLREGWRSLYGVWYTLSTVHSRTLRDVQQVSDEIAAFDRGLHSVVDAVHSSPRLSSYLLVLGVADYVDGGRGRSWQPYASLAAAAFTASVVDMMSSLRRSRYYR